MTEKILASLSYKTSITFYTFNVNDLIMLLDIIEKYEKKKNDFVFQYLTAMRNHNTLKDQ